ncbi:DUF1214 domain-containing protein [Nocardioides sp. GY 10113]|uniref:DUF1214 domain-containing protein n=1 Tax=Nocardioides sp. GY 10113 TaxID=2569761 RepID=UPI001458391A|nr:DUF1214 domain-containing protein [Nocardioides sp. GY 10113]
MALAVTLGGVPRGPAAAYPPGDVGATTEQYVETFYPLWFTNLQFALAPKNKFIGPDRISPIYQSVVAINDDTLYASSPIDTSDGPVHIRVPASRRVGYSVLLLDAFGNVYDSPVPSKAAGIRMPATRYTLVGPGTGARVPPRAAVLPYDFMFMIFRADKFSGEADLTTQAEAFRRRLRINREATAVVPERDYATPFKLIADRRANNRPIAFLRGLQRAVASPIHPPLPAADQQLVEEFDAAFGDGRDLSPEERAAFADATRTAHAAIVANYLDHRGATNWTHFTNIGDWGTAVLDRSSITEFCQYCNGISTAAYYHAFYDVAGEPLVGATRGGYVINFAAPGSANGMTPDASRFWSLTAYTPRSVELIPNRANKYVVARYTPGLTYNGDGSLTVHISRVKPAGVPAANWLPVRRRQFNVMLRVYGVVAGSTVAENTYLPPPITPAATP